MKAMILAAGYGTRLKNLTKDTPKPLIKVNGIEMINFAINHLKTAQCEEIVVNAHYHSTKLKEYLLQREDVKFKVIEEANILGTGGGIANSREYLDGDDFIVYNCDVYADFSLKAMIEFHQKHRPLATLAVNTRETVRPLLFDRKMRLCGYRGSEAGAVYGDEMEPLPFGFTGIQILSPRIFEYLRGEPPYTSISAYITASRDYDETVLAYDVSANFWLDLGTPEHIEELSKVLRRDVH